MAQDCSQNTDPLKLVREGTSQDDRAPAALDPNYAPVNARTVADGIVFAQGYARLLKLYRAANPVPGDWWNYFGSDVAVPLAIAAIEDVETYKSTIRDWFNFLNDLDNSSQPSALEDRLGYLYSAIGALAQALDWFVQSLPDSVALKGVTQNLIQTQPASAFGRLIAYYKGGVTLGLVKEVAPSPEMRILRRSVGRFVGVLNAGLSKDWIVPPVPGPSASSNGAAWSAYVNGIAGDDSVYNPTGASDVFTRINHCATHSLFRSIFDQFLKAFARVVSDAKAALAETLGNYSGHAPHYALFLAFLQLMERVRTAGNALTGKHLDFYYRVILGLKEKPAEPGQVHLLAELAKQAASYDFAPGQLFKAGKDATGKNAFFANLADFVANKAVVAALKTVYRHGNEPVDSSPSPNDQDRIFASPVSNSGDGQGAPLTSPDQSWQPFFNKVYADGALQQIDMPEAQVGFAIASHYLLAAEGARTINVTFTMTGQIPVDANYDFTKDVLCSLTTAKGWLPPKAPQRFRPVIHERRVMSTPLGERLPPLHWGSTALELEVDLTGADDAIVPYSASVHGYNFDTDLPVLLVTLLQDDTRSYVYSRLQGLELAQIDLSISVGSATIAGTGVKTLAVSNDFGPIDLSKPFQPFGSSPVTGSSLVIGSKEIFQKNLTQVEIDLVWQSAPTVYPSSASFPAASVDVLEAGAWTTRIASTSIVPSSDNTANISFDPQAVLKDGVLDAPDFSPNEIYSTSARQGFLRLSLKNNIGQDSYTTALLQYVSDPKHNTPPGSPPQGPVAAALTMSYTAATTLPLNSTSETYFKKRAGRFFHLAPFGTAEQHPYLSGSSPVPLVPLFQFTRNNMALASEAEFYIGVTGLAPPQNLSLLFQVSDGTANPLAPKPIPHIDWCYLADNQWKEFPENAVTDSTGELLDSGIVTFAVPGDATSDNTLLPPGMFWIRAAVHEASDAVCRLLLVAAQAMRVVFSDQGNALDFSATPLPPGTVTQLATPVAAVKSITQPFPSFGGRGAEQQQDFYLRVSERLRHKDRAIDLWDYERLILEAFPQIYKVKCLNHTHYEPADPSDAGSSGPCAGGVYRELAPGHITMVALPNLKSQQQRDPLKPYTSLGVLQEIQSFLGQRVGGFVQLHVKNPQFEELRVSFKLQLRDGYDQAYYTRQLQQAITRFLSPWAFDGSGVPSFGGKVYKSALVNFVEQQPYVDFVTDFKLFQDIPCQPPGTVDLDEASASRAISILVSAPAGQHQISPIGAAPDQSLAETCGCDA